jgi:hypothetical protein
LACRSLVAQAGAAAGCATACGDVAGFADVVEAGEAGVEEAEDAAADDAAADEGADNVVEAEDTGAGGAEDELPAAHPVTTAPAAATPASLSNNKTVPAITNHSF